MSTLERLKELNQKKFPTDAEMSEAYYALDKLLALVEAAKDVLLSTQAPVDRELAMQESLSDLLDSLNALES